MKRTFFLCGIFLIHCIRMHAQTSLWKGIVQSNQQVAIAGATIMIWTKDTSKVIGYSLTGTDGRFFIDPQKIKQEKFIVVVRHISFKEIQRLVIVVNGQIKPGALDFMLSPEQVELKEVIIQREPAVVENSDTIQFNAASFRNAETRKVEDLLKNIQGFSADAQGRLSFNGKQVEKVLIDGDDLAGKGYRMITKNLNAVLVDKIQVIDNYNDNRLLRNVEYRDKVGINLKISAGFHDRVSGGISGGASLQGRYLADANLVYLTKPGKLLSFMNYNNIAEDPAGNTLFYYDEEGITFDYPANEEINKQVLSAGSIHPPEINEHYVLDNNDAGSSAMSSWNIGRFTKMKAIAGADLLNRFRRSASNNNSYISASENWKTENYQEEKFRAIGMMAGFSMLNDKLRKHIFQADLAFKYSGQQNAFGNLSSGSLTDTLTETLNGRHMALRFKWEESFLWRKNVVFKTSLILHKESGIQELKNESNRYLGYFGLDSAYTINNQELAGNYLQGVLDSRISGTNQKWRYQYGIILSWYNAQFVPATRIYSRYHPSDYVDTGINNLHTALGQSKAFLNLSRIAGKKNFFSMKLQGGFARLKWGNEQRQFPLLKLDMGFTRSFTPLKTFQVKYFFDADFRDYPKIYPGGLISGNGSILDGLIFSGPAKSTEVSFVYRSVNLYKNTLWISNLTYSRGHRLYNQSIFASPEYTTSYYAAFDHNARVLALIQGEKFLKVVRSKLGFTLSGFVMKSEYAVNGETGIALRKNLYAEGRWSTGFRLPVNFEGRVNVNFSESSWLEQVPRTNWRVTCGQKLKINSGKKAYGALSWNIYLLSKGNSFHALDFFFIFRHSQRLSFSLSGYNLLNAGTIKERIIMPYAATTTDHLLVGRYTMFRIDLQL